MKRKRFRKKYVEDERLPDDNEISLEELKDQEKKEEGSDELDNPDSSDKALK